MPWQQWSTSICSQLIINTQKLFFFCFAIDSVCCWPPRQVLPGLVVMIPVPASACKWRWELKNSAWWVMKCKIPHAVGVKLWGNAELHSVCILYIAGQENIPVLGTEVERTHHWMYPRWPRSDLCGPLYILFSDVAFAMCPFQCRFLHDARESASICSCRWGVHLRFFDFFSYICHFKSQSTGYWHFLFQDVLKFPRLSFQRAFVAFTIGMGWCKTCLYSHICICFVLSFIPTPVTQ